MSTLNEYRREERSGGIYRNISRKQETEQKKEDPKPVAKGKEKKKSIGQRLTDSFLCTSGDDIKDRVIFDWVIPGIKNIMEDILHMILFGEKVDPRIKRERGESRMSVRPYNKYYSDDRRDKERYIPSDRERRSREPEVIYPTKADAEEVMVKMFDIVADGQRATLKDLYSLSDMPTDFAMSNWGWRDLTGMDVVQVRGGWMLKMPRMEELRR